MSNYGSLNDQIALTSHTLITVHQFPDIDAIGSALALCIYLRSLGKDAVVWTAQALDDTFSFLPQRELIVHDIPFPFIIDTLFILDCSNIERVKDYKKLPLEDQTIVNIDHHPDNENFGDINCVKLVSSVGELLTQYFVNHNISISSDMATCLYAAISFDTGRFAHSNVTQHTHFLASKLLESGASPFKVTQAMEENKTPDDFALVKNAIDSLVVLEDLPVAYTTISINKPSKIKIIDFIRQLGNVDVFIVFQVLNQQLIKINLRSKTDFDVSSFSQHFGGGGHRKASGILYKGSLKECQREIIDSLKEAMQRYCV